MSKKIKVAVIGCGGIAAAIHFPSLKRMETVEITGACDLSEERLKLVNERFGITEGFKDYKVMLGSIEADAVYYLASPLKTEEIVTECLNHSKHVMMEKPPGARLEETKNMAALAKKKGVKTMVAFNRRFAPVIRKVMEKIRSKRAVTSCLAEFHKNNVGRSIEYGLPSWLVMDVIHQLDTLIYIAGSYPKSVKAHTAAYYALEKNYHAALIEFNNGVNGILCSNFASGTRYERHEVHAKECAAYMRLPTHAELYGSKGEEIIKVKDLTGAEEVFVNYGYLGETQHFIDCIMNDKQPETNLEHAVKIMELIETILN